MLEKHKRETYESELDQKTIKDLWNRYIKVIVRKCSLLYFFFVGGYVVIGHVGRRIGRGRPLPTP